VKAPDPVHRPAWGMASMRAGSRPDPYGRRSICLKNGGTSQARATHRVKQASLKKKKISAMGEIESSVRDEGNWRGRRRGNWSSWGEALYSTLIVARSTVKKVTWTGKVKRGVRDKPRGVPSGVVPTREERKCPAGVHGA